MTSPDLTDANIDKLTELFPSVVTETRDAEGNPKTAIDFDLLRQELSDHVVEGPQERYHLDWPGKRAAAFAANAPIAKTLRPVREESVDFDTTENLFIEGDNLEALKLLQESYLGKVKLIYIDPPYNTGSDFVYADSFAATKAEELRRSGQVSDDGVPLVANTNANGRFHSDWLSMMYPRLRLARNLLRNDGIIAISIDENEHANLAVIADEVFGRANYMATLVWRTRTGSNDPGVSVSTDHEYVLLYGRTSAASLRGLEKIYDNYANPDGDPRGPWIADNLTCNKTSAERPNLNYTIVDPKTNISYEANPNRVWAYERTRMAELIKDGRVLFSADGTRRPALKRFQAELRSDRRPLGSLIEVSMGLSATKNLKKLFDGENLFSHPKGVDLVKLLVEQGSSGDDIVLDFFAGSATTGHAVMSQNRDDGGRRRFILVQLPEEFTSTARARELGYRTVSELSRERLRRSVAALDLDESLRQSIGGFRTLRIDTSNLRDVHRIPDETDQLSLTDLEDSVKKGRSGEDLLFQVMLDWGLELTMEIAIEKVDGQDVFVVEDGALIACFDSKVSSELVRTIAQRGPLRAVFRDSSFASDNARINAEQIFREVSPSTDVKAI